MRKNQLKILVLFTTLLLSAGVISPPEAAAKVFRNAYISFDLPDRWECKLEQTEWVCRITDPGQAEAIMILTAKEAGPSDSLANYESYLQKPRTVMTRTGQPLQSHVYEVKQETINNLPWVNGFHFGSEVLNYYTRYLATVKEKVAVLVTFSAHKLYYTKYSKDFFHTISSLNVVATKALLSNSTGKSSVGPFGAATAGDLPGEPGNDDVSAENQGGFMRALLAIALIVGATGAYILMKRKQKKKK